MFQESGFSFIRGIVSIKQPTETKIAAFTDLADHIDWILSVRDEVDFKTNKKLSSLPSNIPFVEPSTRIGTNEEPVNKEPVVWVHPNENITYFDKTLLLVS